MDFVPGFSFPGASPHQHEDCARCVRCEGTMLEDNMLDQIRIDYGHGPNH